MAKDKKKGSEAKKAKKVRRTALMPSVPLHAPH